MQDSGPTAPSFRDALRSPLVRRRLVFGTLVALVTLYAAALRADALAGKYGPLHGPAWVGAVNRLAAAGAHLRPRSVTWRPLKTPYVGGDPINYIKYAREMESFYQPNAREPVFLTTTRGFLWLLDDQDVAVSYASAAASVVLVPATFLLGAAAFGPWIGLAAAAGWAIEFDAIAWAVDGWRDDTFALFFILTAWTFVSMRQRGTRGSGLLAGVFGALACLTRLTSLSFVLAGLVWTVVQPGARVGRLAASRAAAIAALVTVLGVGPYMASCWQATGDPFHAINYYTRYYGAAQGLTPGSQEGAASFVLRQLARPIAAFDTASGGLLSWPFTSKWTGFSPWTPLLGKALWWCAAAGLFALAWSADGRLLLILLLSSLVPYMFTWAIGGGNAWRFTEHVYPIYLIGAFVLIDALARGLLVAARRPLTWWQSVPRPQWLAVGAAVGVAVLALAVNMTLPLFVSREALASDEAVTLDAGRRSRVYFTGIWSAPRANAGGTVIVRAAEEPSVGLRLLLPRAMDCWLTLRLDPAETVDPARQPSVSVFVNRRYVARLALTRDPARIGTYRFHLSENVTRAGINQIELHASHVVAASEAGPQFAWLDKSTPVAFRLWYLRLEPSRTGATPADAPS